MLELNLHSDARMVLFQDGKESSQSRNGTSVMENLRWTHTTRTTEWTIGTARHHGGCETDKYDHLLLEHAPPKQPLKNQGPRQTLCTSKTQTHNVLRSKPTFYSTTQPARASIKLQLFASSKRAKGKRYNKLGTTNIKEILGHFEYVLNSNQRDPLPVEANAGGRLRPARVLSASSQAASDRSRARRERLSAGGPAERHVADRDWSIR